ncbi:MAG: glutamate synthase subunit alpha, partial [Thermomicrobiales bacterium]|nr:glutamate synthase subunit alpha [Thermomicrobiales bacterium]
MKRSVDGQATFPLYDGAYEHDSCGVGLVVDIEGTPSRRIVELALGGLVNLTHRGGVGADERTGDGAGILTQLPHELFAKTLAAFGSEATAGTYGVATVFLPNDTSEAATARALVETAASELGAPVLGWRVVPVDTSVLGRIASETRPEIEQLFLGRPGGQNEAAFERTLMLLRKGAERRALEAGIDDFYIASCSCRTIIYKGFCLPEDLAEFYLDLQQPEFTSAIGLFHQRYSTNTLPTWAMAQPFRYIAHNGEINTVQGNRNWMTARAPELRYADGVGPDRLSPVVSLTGSDSASFDNVVEFLYHGQRSLPH